MSNVAERIRKPVSEAAAVRHMLSIDVEEYFHAEAAVQAGVDRGDWSTLASRLDGPIDRLLYLLAEHNVSATFFVLGWVAARRGELVRRIAQAGHEIASHGFGHDMLTRLSPESFRKDLRDSLAALSDASGAAVRGYRAPTFSVLHDTAWALDVLAEEGLEYDSSIFPVRHDRYGVPEAPRRAHWAMGPGGGRILEIPPLTARLARVNLPMAGGGYLRLLPVQTIGWALQAWQRAGWSGMVYLHPWELDPDQPDLPMKPLSRWRHRVGLARTEVKLAWLLRRFAFSSAERSLDKLRRQADQTHLYGCRMSDVRCEM